MANQKNKEMTLKERIFAAETALGKLLIKLSIIFGVITATVGELGEYQGWIPQDFIPMWAKTVVALIYLGGVVYGKLTVKKEG